MKGFLSALAAFVLVGIGTYFLVTWEISIIQSMFENSDMGSLVSIAVALLTIVFMFNVGLVLGIFVGAFVSTVTRGR